MAGDSFPHPCLSESTWSLHEKLNSNQTGVDTQISPQQQQSKLRGGYVLLDHSHLGGFQLQLCITGQHTITILHSCIQNNPIDVGSDKYVPSQSTRETKPKSLDKSRFNRTRSHYIIFIHYIYAFSHQIIHQQQLQNI